MNDTVRASFVQACHLASFLRHALKRILNGARVAPRWAIPKLRATLAETQSENAALRERVLQLEGIAEIGSSIEFKDTAYWRRADVADKGPFCPLCWDHSRKLVHLHESYAFGSSEGYSCMICRQGFA